ncbi:pseudouridine synthase [Thamnocephalis sphaerospora]|uniref:tRNA pseudouridine(55) synthase n=1 Tax=Thamnocephalis sphaerospora TaxID=78915 RepID=A0A4P9XKK3_9FUNG|nr:pseudouridine synthase [Thamnocephalis sphaerospora]|eukprot:RKP05790.1 pseudouridine synthase [Thamnocephalis sphaerospora]
MVDDRKNKHKKKGRFVKPLYKIGHGGTLDPLASGVLVVAVGTGTKQLQSYLDGSKVYVGEGLFGAVTDTYDSEGKTMERAPYVHVTREALESVLDQFRGTIQQIPPKYSALKVNGRPMYEYARKGLEIPREIAAREVTIHSLTLEAFTTEHDYTIPAAAESGDDGSTPATTENTPAETQDDQPRPAMFRIRVECGGGTYIRSLIYDIGRAVNSAAHMVKLTRVQQGCFVLGDNVQEVEACDITTVPKMIEDAKQRIAKQSAVAPATTQS